MRPALRKIHNIVITTRLAFIVFSRRRQCKLRIHLLLAKVCDQATIANMIYEHAAIRHTDDHLFLVEKKEGFWCLEVGDCAALLRNDIVEAQRSIERFNKKVLVELLKEFHACKIAFISHILQCLASLYVQENHWQLVLVLLEDQYH